MDKKRSARYVKQRNRHLKVQRDRGQHWKKTDWWTQAMERRAKGYRVGTEVGTESLTEKTVQALCEYAVEFKKLSRKEKLWNEGGNRHIRFKDSKISKGL